MAKPAPDPFVKRKLEEESSSKRLRTDAEDLNCSPMDRIKFITTPLWNMPYSSQVKNFIWIFLGNIKSPLYIYIFFFS